MLAPELEESRSSPWGDLLQYASISMLSGSQTVLSESIPLHANTSRKSLTYSSAYLAADNYHCEHLNGTRSMKPVEGTAIKDLETRQAP